ncbi:MAG: SDR family NAD(P)-dependent oxidoreductase [Janthinobacterium lividum]
MTLHVLTGASRGLGAAMLVRLLRDGHHVVAAARGPAPELREHAGRLDWTRLDLGDLAAAQDWVIRTLAGCEPQASVLILNAGSLDPLVPVENLRPDAVEAHLRINLASPMLVTAGFLEATRAWPVPRRILAISSGAGRRGVSHWSAYCSSKAGLDNFIRSLNAEYAGQTGASVRAVSLAPGVLDTAMQQTIRSLDAPDRERFRTLHAEGRLTSPDDAADAILAYLDRDDFGMNEIDDIRNY